MRILVCGGRDFSDRKAAFTALDRIHHKRGISCIIDGAARGADQFGSDWAKLNEVANERHPANWTTHGKRTGFVRNRTMLATSNPDMVVAFPGGVGTANMIAIVRAVGITVWEPTKSA